MQITLSNIKSTAPAWIDGYAKSRGRDAADLRLFVDNADAFKDGDKVSVLLKDINNYVSSAEAARKPRADEAMTLSEFSKATGIPVKVVVGGKPARKEAEKAGGASAASAAPTVKRAATAKARKPAATKAAKGKARPAKEYDYVPELSESERIIKAFARLDGRPYDRLATVRLLKRLQAAIVSRRIRRADAHADLIERAQAALLKIIDRADEGQTLQIHGIGDFTKAVGDLRVSKDVAALRAFVGEAPLWRTVGGYRMRDGEVASNDVVESRLVRLGRRLRAAGGKACLKAAEYVSQYVKGERDRIAYEHELSGLRGLAGLG